MAQEAVAWLLAEKISVESIIHNIYISLRFVMVCYHKGKILQFCFTPPEQLVQIYISLFGRVKTQQSLQQDET